VKRRATDHRVARSPHGKNFHEPVHFVHACGSFAKPLEAQISPVAQQHATKQDQVRERRGRGVADVRQIDDDRFHGGQVENRSKDARGIRLPELLGLVDDGKFTGWRHDARPDPSVVQTNSIAPRCPWAVDARTATAPQCETQRTRKAAAANGCSANQMLGRLNFNTSFISWSRIANFMDDAGVCPATCSKACNEFDG